ncbi:MAG TPA: hypothetical protein VLF39_01005 [Candidatus Saccharimonadales bacterium]|nr:hypothetical protein [Candidatus Saccharimonadales bacterium]
MVKFYQQTVKFIGSKSFFVVILLIFGFSAGWLAVSSRYPMAFDEDYHLGLIQLHAQQNSPIFTHQPTGVARYGALTRDPSYLYHYLMSWPYRWLNHTNISVSHLIVTLRFINIGLFMASLVVFRKLFSSLRASPQIINISFLFFVLTPVVPLLAAHINYDNLQILLLAIVLLLMIKFKLSLAKKPDGSSLINALTISLLGCLVKFTFLPFLTAIVIYMVIELVSHQRRNLLAKFKTDFKAKPVHRQIVLMSGLVLATALFINTYGVNLIKYHNPVPQCGQVLGVERCAAYPPWNRNHLAALTNTGVDPSPLRFSVGWIWGMFDRLFFTINGHGQTADNTNYLAPIMAGMAILIIVFGVYLLIKHGREILAKDPILNLILFVSIVYIMSLWGRNYHDYLNLGRMVAINGRYLVPVILPFYILLAQAYQRHLAGQVKAKAILLLAACLAFSQGGGVISFMYYSNPDWYWPHDQFVNQINSDAKRLVKPLFVAGNWPYHRR